jgi:glycosyltransferase involved in cell wall biosynthesis
MSRIFLCDPSLINFSGHCLGYLNAIKKGLPSDSETFLLGNKAYDRDLLKSQGVFPIFTHWIDHREYDDPVRNMQYHNKVMIRDLSNAHGKFNFISNDRILINSLRQWSLLGVLRWLETFKFTDAPVVILILHFSAFTGISESNKAWDRLYQEFFKALNISPMRGKVKLFADSDELAQEYSTQGARSIVVCPIPHIPKIPEHDVGETLTVSYMGAARADKGFQYIQYLTKCAQYSKYKLPDVRFKIMAWSDNPKGSYYLWNIESLRKNPKVELYKEPLSQEDYEALLGETDIGMILYDKYIYSRQTSGILFEYIAAGAVILGSRGTWVARQVAQYGLGVLSMPNDAVSIGEAFLDILTNYSLYKKRQQKGRAELLQFHNPDNFTKTVFGVDQ